MITTILGILVWIFFILSVFLAKELFKKFGFWKAFQKNYSNQLIWLYDGKKNPGMYTFQMKWMRAFDILIWFDLDIGSVKNIWYDIFWYMQSSHDGTLYFSTYLDTSVVEFIFLVQGIDSKDISILCMENANWIIANYIFYPHWWQKMWLYK